MPIPFLPANYSNDGPYQAQDRIGDNRPASNESAQAAFSQ